MLLQTHKTITVDYGPYELEVTFKVPTPVEAEVIKPETKDSELVKQFVTTIKTDEPLELCPGEPIEDGADLCEAPGARGAVRDIAVAIINSTILSPEEKN